MPEKKYRPAEHLDASKSCDSGQFHAAFFDEADDLLHDIEQSLLQLSVAAPEATLKRAPEGGLVDALFRAVHSIKGGAAAFECFPRVGLTAHLFEDVLDDVRCGQIPLNAATISLFLDTNDAIKAQLDRYRHNIEQDDCAFRSICSALRALSDQAGQAARTGHVRTFKLSIDGVGPHDAALILAELKQIGIVQELTQSMGVLTLDLETDCQTEDVVAVCGFVVQPNQISLVPSQAFNARDAIPLAPRSPLVTGKNTGVLPSLATSVRVSTEKLNRLEEVAGDLVLTQSLLARANEVLDPVAHERVLFSLVSLERQIQELQHSLRAVRLLNFELLFLRLTRLAHDVARRLDKQVEVRSVGAAIELEKEILDGLVNPLIHLVRNSVDHGIEHPAARVASGKDPFGRLTITADRLPEKLIVEITDDGGGLNRADILGKAHALGLPIANDAPDEEVWDLIFGPGFSTAKRVTDMSGRGFGLDVVRQDVQALGGSVRVSSCEDHGTVTLIQIPLARPRA